MRRSWFNVRSDPPCSADRRPRGGRWDPPGASAPRSGNHPTAFTLIELLVVMAIVSLMMSILLPSLSRAREQAKQVGCRNNLRAIWSGIIQYSLNYMDRVPFMEDINLNDPNADPFDPKSKTTVGRMLAEYVNPKNWRCPGAIHGFPENRGPEGWTMTYWFRSAGAVGQGVPFHSQPWGTGKSLDPLVSNYVNFDGRPLQYVSGRRHTPSNRRAPNRDEIGPWTYSFPIVADLVLGDESAGTPRYPHVGLVDRRNDLEAARPLFEELTGSGRLPSRLELHTVGGRKTDIFLTRVPYRHQAGF